MKRKSKISREQNTIQRILEKDPVIIPQDGGHQEDASLPSEDNPWPGLVFFIGLTIAVGLLWSFAPTWFRHLFLKT